MNEVALEIIEDTGPALRRRWPALVAVVLVVLLVTGGVAWFVVHKVKALPGDAVMKVSGTTVTVAQLDRRIEILSALYSIKPPTEAAERATFRRDAAKSMALSLILEAAAKREHITVSKAQAQAQLQNVIESKMLGDEKTYDQFLASAGVTNADVLAEVTRVMQTSQLYTKVTGKVPAATETEAKAYYAAHQDEMVTPEQRSISNIVVGSEADAQQVVGKLRQGQGFAAVAKTDSLDTSTSGKGGRLGSVQASQLEDDYAKAAFAAQQGAVFGPVETSNGWNVGVVTKIVPSSPVAFDDAKDTLVQTLTTQAQVKAWTRWIGTQLTSAAVRYADRYRPAHPDAPPSSMPTS